ncbi:MAG: OmpH family outer membrane protein [Alphaproteobacteria bacterium]|nr:OmpH family outer membrane protein [Alphaproteobacteria bacterium]
MTRRLAVLLMIALAPVVAVLVGAVALVPAKAQEAKLPIAVVDVQGVMRASKAAKVIQTKIDARRDTYQEEVTAEERRLRQAEQELVQQRAILSPEAYQQRVKDFQTEVAEVQRGVQSRKRTLDEAFAKAMNEVRRTLVGVVAEIAEHNGIKVVLFKSQIVIAEKTLDISEQVLARLDERLPSVDVALPSLK